MKNSFLQTSVILFDLGFTLINFEGDFKQAMVESYSALARSLIAAGCDLDEAAFVSRFNEVISHYYHTREIDLIERPVEESLRKALGSFGLDHLPGQLVQDAIQAMYLYTENYWKVEPDTHATLEALQVNGYRLGLISNAANPLDLNRLIDDHDLRKYFEVILISAEEGIRKPDPRIIQRALDRLGVNPEEAVLVGDTLNADILGAHNAGVKGIWITRRASRPDNLKVKDKIVPAAEIPDLTSLLPLLGT